MKSDMIWTLVAFAFYLAGMLLIGAAYMKKTKSSEDFFLGGRGLNGWVAALSAQASDMSAWRCLRIRNGADMDSCRSAYRHYT